MRTRTLTVFGIVALVALLASSAARAEQNVPGSVLVFPYVDTSKTIISISNSYLDEWIGPEAGILLGGNVACVEDDDLSGTVGQTGVHLIFFQYEPDTPALNCQHYDAFIPLMTPQDHASFIPEDTGLIPGGLTGWLVAFAVKPFTSEDGDPIPWSFDFLTGQAWNADGGSNFTWSHNAYPFLSGDYDEIPADEDTVRCERTLYDSNGYLNFDGDEYEAWADELILPRFFEEADDGALYDSLVSLISPLSTDINRRNYEVTFSTLFWNNDENGIGTPFSRTTDFVCMFIGNLREISAQFEDLGGTADEPELDTGWLKFYGRRYADESHNTVNTDPPLLGVFAQYNTDPTDDRKNAGANFFTRGFNYVEATIQFDFINPGEEFPEEMEEPPFADDMEDGQQPEWGVSAEGFGLNDWAIVSSANARSPQNVWFVADEATVADKFLDLTVDIPTTETVFEFYHLFDMETGFDGGVLEISTDDGTSFNDLEANITEGGYNDTISEAFGNPIGGQNAWSGVLGPPMERVAVDLSAFAGQMDAIIRFRHASDSSVADVGWEIDDVGFVAP